MQYRSSEAELAEHLQPIAPVSIISNTRDRKRPGRLYCAMMSGNAEGGPIWIQHKQVPKAQFELHSIHWDRGPNGGPNGCSEVQSVTKELASEFSHRGLVIR